MTAAQLTVPLLSCTHPAPVALRPIVAAPTPPASQFAGAPAQVAGLAASLLTARALRRSKRQPLSQLRALGGDSSQDPPWLQKDCTKEELQDILWLLSTPVPLEKRCDSLICPRCKGGDKREKNFSALLREVKGHQMDLKLWFKCWRANKCGWSGYRYFRREQLGDFSLLTADANPRADFAPMKTEPVRGLLLKWLVEERKLDPEVLKRNRVSQSTYNFDSYEEDVIIFPYLVGGEVVAEKFRTIQKRFSSNPGGKPCLYGVDGLEGAKKIIIVEGEMDKLSIETAGLEDGEAVVSLQSGAKSGIRSTFPFGHGALDALEAAESIVIAVDGDQAGCDCAKALAETVGRTKCWFVKWPQGTKDANDVLMQFGKAELRRVLREDNLSKVAPLRPMPGTVVQWDDLLEDVKKRVYGKIPEELIRGVSTGWPSLDEYYRVVPAELTIVTAKPNEGKSEWLLSLAVNLALDHDWRVMICSFELANHQVVDKLAHKYFKKSLADIGTETFDERKDEFFGWVDEHFVTLSNEVRETPDIDKILAEAQTHVDKGGLKGLLIDPYNYLQTQIKDTETNAISNLLTKVQNFAKRSKVHVWIVVHPSKPLQGKWNDSPIPSLYSVAGSANWFNKTDMGIVINRVTIEDPTTKKKKTRTNKVQVLVQKVRNREAGKLSCEDNAPVLEYNPETGRYDEVIASESEYAGTSPASVSDVDSEEEGEEDEETHPSAIKHKVFGEFDEDDDAGDDDASLSPDQEFTVRKMQMDVSRSPHMLNGVSH